MSLENKVRQLKSLLRGWNVSHLKGRNQDDSIMFEHRGCGWSLTVSLNGTWDYSQKDAGSFDLEVRDDSFDIKREYDNIAWNTLLSAVKKESKIIEGLHEAVKNKENEVDETTATGNVQGYATPGAFSASDEDAEEKEDRLTTLAHGTLAKRISENSKIFDLDEVTYREFKYEEDRTPRQKIGQSIKEINGMLFRIKRIIEQNKKLKTELGITKDDYWKSTHVKLEKVTRKVLSIVKALQELRTDAQLDEKTAAEKEGRAGERAKHLRKAGKKDANKRTRKGGKNIGKTNE